MTQSANKTLYSTQAGRKSSNLNKIRYRCWVKHRHVLGKLTQGAFVPKTRKHMTVYEQRSDKLSLSVCSINSLNGYSYGAGVADQECRAGVMKKVRREREHFVCD